MAWKGNPDNPAPNSINNTESVVEKKFVAPRADQIRRDTDDYKNFTVNLLDIDTAIFEYLDNVVNPTVEDNGENIKVPILYGSPERWKAIQLDGGIRDNNGKLQLPAIMFKRNTVAKSENLATFNRHLNVQVLKRYDEKNKYDRFSILTKKSAPTGQLLNVTLPDHVTMTYEFMLWTEYVEQMNALIEKINWATEEYWGDPKRFKFRVYIQDYSNTTEVASGKDRMVRTTFNMTVQAYLLSDSFENKKLTTTKSFTPRKVIISSEVTDAAGIESVKQDLQKTSYKKPQPYNGENNTLVADEDVPYVRTPTFSSTEGSAVVNNEVASKIVEIFNAYKLPSNNQPSPSSCCGLVWHTPPNESTDYGEEGWMAYDENFHYIYVNNKWVRQPLSNFTNF